MLNRVVFLFLLVVLSLFSEDNYLDIDAKHFEANEKKQILHFKGDVKMTKNKDILLCQDLLINTYPKDGKQFPKDYKATGDVSFTVHTETNVLKGKGDTVFYNPEKKQYKIVGNGYLEDITEGKKLTAHTIYIDEATGKTKIDGDKDKPVKFRLKLNEDKK
jgi:lipopolysaccharide export system protein LptA